MKKQTKLVAVLSTAALLAIGASMTSFAGTGWKLSDEHPDRDGYYVDANGVWDGKDVKLYRLNYFT